jgi:hypothetical protein
MSRALPRWEHTAISSKIEPGAQGSPFGSGATGDHRRLGRIDHSDAGFNQRCFSFGGARVARWRSALRLGSRGNVEVLKEQGPDGG